MSDTTSVTNANEPTPVLSLRDVVVYPYMVIPLFVGRERSILALDQAMNVDKRIVLVTQRSPDVDDPSAVTTLSYKECQISIKPPSRVWARVGAPREPSDLSLVSNPGMMDCDDVTTLVREDIMMMTPVGDE